LISALYEARDGPNGDRVEDVRKILANDFKNHFMMTSTRLNYYSVNTDEVLHDYKNPDEKKIELELTGKNGLIAPDNSIEAVVEALLGVKDVFKVQELSRWVTGENPYLWRLNQKPSQVVERALVLGVGGVDNGFDVDAGDGIGNDRPARGAAVVRENKGFGHID